MAKSPLSIPPRNDIPVEFTWNSANAFPSKVAWEEEMQVISESLSDFDKFKGRLASDATTLAQVIEALDGLKARAEKMLVYAGMSYFVDTTNQEAGNMFSRANAVFSQMQAATSFIEPEVLEIGKDTLERWLQDEPALRHFEHFFDDLFRRSSHIRSGEVEELLGMLTEPFNNVALTGSIFTDGDLRFEPGISQEGDSLPITQGTWETILRGTDRDARQSTWENYRDTYLAYQNTLASNLTTAMKQNVFFARARKHVSTLSATLFEPDIPGEVYYNLIDTFHRNLPTWHRFWDIRRRALGVETLHPYDIWAPLTSSRPSISFEQGVDWICKALLPLGENYVSTLRQGCLSDRWIDLLPNQGKTSGAFSWGAKGTYPFIVMSYDETIYGLSILAHELGHSMHSNLTWQNQPALYSDYSLFVGEVASNFNQAMLSAYLLDTIEESDFQISVIEEAMSNFHRYFLIMPTLARFELQAYERLERGEGLTAEGMNELTADLFAEAYGPAMHIDRERVGITWATFSHLYTKFYVYQYATGISGAHDLAKQIQGGKDPSNYLAFLSSGSSLYPLDALKLAGVDLTSPEPIERAFARMATMVDRLEALVLG